MSMFYHCDRRNLAATIGNVVAAPDYSRPLCNLNLYNINMTIYKAWEAPFALSSPLGGLIVGIPPHGVCQPKKNRYASHVRTVGWM
jgi:hypothetical protein